MSCLQLWALHHSGPPPQHLDPRTHLDQLHREQNTSVSNSNSNTQEAALHNTEVSKTCKTSCTACVVIITTHTHTHKIQANTKANHQISECW